MNGKEVEFLLRTVEMWMRILSTRTMLMLTLLLTFSLFVWTMYQPDYWRLASATIFAIAVFLPVRALDAQKEKSNASQNREEG